MLMMFDVWFVYYYYYYFFLLFDLPTIFVMNDVDICVRLMPIVKLVLGGSYFSILKTLLHLIPLLLKLTIFIQGINYNSTYCIPQKQRSSDSNLLRCKL